MRIRMLVSLATVAACYVAGSEVDMPDDEAQRLIDAGQASDPTGKATARPQRQVMDRRKSTPVEGAGPVDPARRPAGPEAGPQQTAAAVEATAAASVDRSTQQPGVGSAATAAPVAAPPTAPTPGAVTPARPATTPPGADRGKAARGS